jgi:hypothetical protein
LFRVVRIGVSAGQLAFCSGFDSRQLHQKGRRSGSCRGSAPVGGVSRRASLRYIRSWRCHCGGDNPSRTCDGAKVSARAAKRPVPRRIPALSGRTSAHRATAPSAFGPRRLPGRIAPAINPQKKPRRKNPRARRLFLRTPADAMNPHVAAMMATASSREIRCVSPSDPISQPPGRRLRRPLARSNHRLRRTSIAGQYS